MKKREASPHYVKLDHWSPYQWNPESVKEIIKLFHEGHGADSIGIKMRIPNSAVRKLLNEHGLRRTRAEAIRMKTNAYANENRHANGYTKETKKT